MKRIVLVVLVLAAFAGQASADMFTLSKDDAMSLDAVYWSGDGGSQWLNVTDDLATYQAGNSGISMQGWVGYYGALYSSTGDPSVQIGGYTGDLSSYEGYSLFLANDNDDSWQVRLYVTTNDGTSDSTWETEWETLYKETNKALVLDFSDLGVTDQGNVVDLGFWIKGGNDNFHISAVVPVPAAVLIGTLGLAVAGLKLRKYV